MLKGHVFSRQLFGHPIFALFINTFLNGKNGISNNYKNGMTLSYSESNITIQSGAVCIQGRFLEEDTASTISAGVDNAYCKLVIEIDLDKTNTESDFQQGAYKVIKGSNNFPSLTQTNIVKNNMGIYQYELARFRTNSNGISDFQDMRTFIDFDSIYSEIEQHIEDLDAGSVHVKKSGDTMTGLLVANGGVQGNLTGNVTGNVTGNTSGSSGSCTGNANSATKLQNARTIGISGGATGTATSFNGTSNITIPVTSLDASKLTGTASVATTGNAGSATKLKDARTINGTSFNGTANITTSKWGTARTIGLSGAVSGSASVDGSGNVTITTTQANIAIITGSMVVSASPNPGNQYAQSSKNISYPSGYNNTNCVCISFGTTRDNRANQYSYDGSEGIGSVSSVYVTGNLPKGLHLGNDNMFLNISSMGSSDVTINYKIILMKTS